MAFSILERPKLHTAKSLKFYPEEYESNNFIPFRHKTLSPDFELSAPRISNIKKYKNNNKDDISLRPTANSDAKCPMHNIHKMHDDSKDISNRKQEGDFKRKKEKKGNCGDHNKAVASVIDKLEETYWANWKPDKAQTFRSDDVPHNNNTRKEIRMIKDAPSSKNRIKIHPDMTIRNCSKSPETSTSNNVPSDLDANEDIDDLIETINEVERDKIEKSEDTQTETDYTQDTNSCSITTDISEQVSEELYDLKFLKHTDSIILHSRKKYQGQHEHYEQPQCIRLYKKQTSARAVDKSSSHPLRSCLKKDTTTLCSKNNRKLGRPRSPMIVQTSVARNSKHRK